MRSVADDLRTEDRRRLARTTPLERLNLAFRLAEDDLALLRASARLTVTEARARIARTRHVGRVRSRAACP